MMIEKAYEECNEHLRESDRKRDQLMVFYTIVVGAFFASTDKLTEANLLEPFSFSLLFLGLTLAFTIIQFRKWHIRYVNTAILLQILSSENKDNILQFTSEFTEVEKINLGINQSWMTNKWIKRYFTGVEFLTYNSFLIISFLPIYSLVQNIRWLSSGNPICVYFASLLIYLISLNGIGVIYLYHDLKDSPWARWLLRGIGYMR